MTPVLLQRRLLAALVILATGLLGWQPSARADGIEAFISVYKKIEAAAPSGALPVTSKDIITYKSLFQCAGGGKDLVVCISEFHNTDSGSNASQELEIPEGVWNAFYAYTAWKAGDVWGVVQHLGTAAACAVLQVLAGGADLCGLIQDLYEVAKGVYDATKWVAEFFGSLGEAAWDTVQDLGCSLGLGGCDSSSGPPPEYYVYAYIFAPRLDEGLAKIEQSDAAFAQLRTLLHQNARKNPAVLSKPFVLGPYSYTTWPSGSFSESATTSAEMGFVDSVDKKWSDDVANKVLAKLGVARHNYAADTSKIAQIATQSAADYVQNQSASPVSLVAKLCAHDFHTQGYEHVDRWVTRHKELALKLVKLGAVTHKSWCSGTFWHDNKSAFAAHFLDYTKTNLCQESGGSLECQKLANYQACSGLLGSVGQAGQCKLNVQAIGKEVAQEIQGYFASQKSKYPCQIETAANVGTPSVLRCTRPTQQYYCNKYYQAHFGPGGKTPLPVKVLDCALTKTGTYQAQEDKLWNETMPDLLALHPGLQTYTAQKGIDPLAIALPGPVFVQVQADAKKHGMTIQPVMSFDPTIDGVATASLLQDVNIVKHAKQTVPAASLTPSKESLGSINPPDPAGTLTINSPVLTSGGFAPAPSKPGSAGLQTGTVADQAVKPSSVPGAGFAPPAPPTKTLRGKLPPGSGERQTTARAAPPPPVAGEPATGGFAPPRPTSTQAGGPPAVGRGKLPDLTSVAVVQIGAGKYPWGATIRLDAAAGKPGHAGLCSFVIHHTLRNQGGSATGPFVTQWQTGTRPAGNRQARPALAAGAIRQESDVIALQPGRNHLTLVIDSSGRIAEANEHNNRFELSIDLRGDCAGRTRTQPEASTNRGERTDTVEPATSEPDGRLSLPARPQGVQRSDVNK